MAQFLSYSKSSWRWIVLKDGKQIGDYYKTKAQADRYAKDYGGSIKRIRY